MSMYKLLVNSPAGGQEIFEVSLSGGYFDETRVIWDERKDGPIADDLALGGMVRVEEAGVARLVFDQALYDHNTYIPPAPPEPPSPPPTEISAWQFHRAMHARGWLADFRTSVFAADGVAGDLLRVDFDKAPIIRRAGALIALLQEARALDAEALDALFIDAAAIH